MICGLLLFTEFMDIAAFPVQCCTTKKFRACERRWFLCMLCLPTLPILPILIRYESLLAIEGMGTRKPRPGTRKQKCISLRYTEVLISDHEVKNEHLEA